MQKKGKREKKEKEKPSAAAAAAETSGANEYSRSNQQDKQTNRLKISLAVSTREGKDAIDFHFVSGGVFLFFFL